MPQQQQKRERFPEVAEHRTAGVLKCRISGTVFWLCISGAASYPTRQGAGQLKGHRCEEMDGESWRQSLLNEAQDQMWSRFPVQNILVDRGGF